ncbi:MAG: hypothetical protein IJJ99_04775 [Oscillospiraceae bacterium]|nr:hypothetical protein [Oscillospiraceae bacterium]
MTNHRRFVAGILAVLVLFAVATLFVLALEADHDCIGEDCPVCAVISSCQKALKTLCGVMIAVASLFACRCFVAAFFSRLRAVCCDKTPIVLKVKLLN